jgi:hypothetical protein
MARLACPGQMMTTTRESTACERGIDRRRRAELARMKPSHKRGVLRYVEGPLTANSDRRLCRPLPSEIEAEGVAVRITHHPNWLLRLDLGHERAARYRPSARRRQIVDADIQVLARRPLPQHGGPHRPPETALVFEVEGGTPHALGWADLRPAGIGWLPRSGQLQRRHRPAEQPRIKARQIAASMVRS